MVEPKKGTRWPTELPKFKSRQEAIAVCKELCAGHYMHRSEKVGKGELEVCCWLVLLLFVGSLGWGGYFLQIGWCSFFGGYFSKRVCYGMEWCLHDCYIVYNASWVELKKESYQNLALLCQHYQSRCMCEQSEEVAKLSRYNWHQA